MAFPSNPSNGDTYTSGGVTYVYDSTPGVWKAQTFDTVNASAALTKIKTVDGSSSGLDADLLDGQSGAYYLDPANISGTLPDSKLSGTYSNVTANNSQQLDGYDSKVFRRNHASAGNWTATAGSQSAVHGGSFGQNGSTSENACEWNTDPFGRRALVWAARNNDANSGGDGGWNKSISGISADKSYMSIVYVKRASSSTNGSFYHGCGGSDTLNLSGTANTNPYFISFNIGSLPLNEWCVSIGIIQANGDTNTSNIVDGAGLWNAETGEKLNSSYTTYKMKSGRTTQIHRTYLYYSTDPNAVLLWWAPGFFEIDGTEPTIPSLMAASGNPSLANGIIRTNADSIGQNVTIPAGTNGMSAGPIEIESGYTVTVNGDWSIV